MQKKVNLNKNLYKVLLVIAVAFVATALVELICNIKLLTLSPEEKGTNSYDYILSDNEEGEVVAYTSYIDGYVDKLVIEYTNTTPVYLDIEVEYYNRFGREETKVITDKNPMYLHSSIVNIKENVISVSIIPLEETTAELGNDVVLTNISVKNVAGFNIFRALFTFLMALCVQLLVVFRKEVGAKVEYGFLIVALCSGIIFSVAMPLSRVSWDEESHLRGVYFLDITGYLEYNKFTENFVSAGLLNNPYEHSASIEEYNMVLEALNTETVIEEGDEIVAHPWSTTRFATFSYMIMAVTCNICKLLGVPFGIMYMLVRLTNLFTYITVIFFAIRKLPKGKILMSAIALMPTPMFLAANTSYDSIVTGFMYLGMAYLFSFVLEDRKISWWEYIVFIGAFGYGASPKAIYIPLVLLGLLIPSSRFKDKKTEKLMKAGVVLAFIALMSTFVLPTIISPSQVGDDRGGDTSHAGQLGTIFGNPIGYAAVLLSTLWEYLFEYTVGTSALDLLGHLGTGSLTYLIAIYLVYVTLTGENTTYVRNSNGDNVKLEFNKVFRGFLLLLIFGVACLIWTSMYLSFTEVGRDVIAGVQGRYYIPLLFPALFALSFNKFNSSYDKGKYNLVCMFVSGFIIFYSIWEVVIVQCCL